MDGSPADWKTTLAAIAIAIVIASAIAEFGVSVVRRWLTRAGAGVAQPATPSRPIKGALRLARLALVGILTGVFAPIVLDLFGKPLRDELQLTKLTHWVLNNGLRVLLITGLAMVVLRAASLFIARLEMYLSDATGDAAEEQRKRAKTISHLASNATRVLVWAAAAVMVLNELDVNTAPLLTGAGILGLAVGFGGQTLVKDVISGFFIIVENQVRVGDVAVINGADGLVEAITLRTIVLRDVRGAVHVFPCGSVNTLTNLTKDYSFAVLDLIADYQHDTDAIVHVMREVADGLIKDESLGPFIVSPLEVLGVEEFTDTGVRIRARLKTIPLKQWDVSREFRRRVKKSFDAKGIQLARTIVGVRALPSESPR